MPNRFFKQNLQQKSKTSKYDNQIFLYLPNGLGTKFQLKLTIFNFWTQTGYFQSKTKNFIITIEIYIPELV